MQISSEWRAPLLLVLLGTLFGLCVWFGTVGPAPALGAYPHEGDVGPNPAPYVGGPVELSGQVVDTNPVRMRIEYGLQQSRTLTVTNVEISTEPGDTFRVYGTLTDPDTVRATNAFAVPPGGLRYTYVVSFVAGLWVFARIVSQWRLHRHQGLVRRTDPLTLRGVLNSAIDGGADGA